MKVAIIGSSQYRKMMEAHAEALVCGPNSPAGCVVRLPILDDYNGTATDIMYRNRDNIEWADEVHLFWDGRSMGAWGDFCMAFALKKPVRAIFLEGRSMMDSIRDYASQHFFQFWNGLEMVSMKTGSDYPDFLDGGTSAGGRKP